MMRADRICLAGDIGGTKTWLLLARGSGGARQVLFEQRYASCEYRSFDLVLERFLSEAAHADGVDAVCLGVAGPVLDQSVKVTNLPWQLVAQQLRERLRAEVRLINDFDATARGIAELNETDLVCLQAGEVLPDAPRLVIGAGTGLGISFSINTGNGYRSIPTESGRNAFAPTTPEQVELWRYLYAHHARATFELLLSGKGLMRIYDFLRLQQGTPGLGDDIATAQDPAAEIVARGMNRDDALCSAAIDLFLQIYGARAGDLALTILARGGVYIAGGIAPKLLPRMRAGAFLDAFRDKGIHSKFVRALPVYLIASERVGLLGSLATAERLAGRGGVAAPV